MSLSAEDRIAIQDLFGRYSYGLDFGDAESFLACFGQTGTLAVAGIDAAKGHGNATFTGPDELRTFLDNIHSGLLGHSRHWVFPVRIEAAGLDHAVAFSYCHILRPGEFPAVGTTLTGIYRDELRRVDGHWMFERREFRADPQPQHAQAVPTDVLVERFDAAGVAK